jgi:hypothetical protein
MTRNKQQTETTLAKVESDLSSADTSLISLNSSRDSSPTGQLSIPSRIQFHTDMSAYEPWTLQMELN